MLKKKPVNKTGKRILKIKKYEYLYISIDE